MVRALLLILIVAALAAAGYGLTAMDPNARWMAEHEATSGEGPADRGIEAAEGEAPTADSEQVATAPAEEPPTTGLPKVRDVTPEGVFSGPINPSRPPEAVAPPTPEQPKEKRYFRVIVQDAGTLRSGTQTIALAGIEAPAADKTCVDESGREWPCGRAAKAALTLFLRGRAVDCRPVSAAETATAATCRSGEEDLGRWLVARGWAEPAEGSDYVPLAEAAKRDKLGLHQAEWRSGADGGGAAGPVTSIVQD